MTVITIAQSKGGAGKTTLALALGSEFAAAGGSVIMLDADRQNSLMNWHHDRMENRASNNSHQNSVIDVIDVSKIADAKIKDAITEARQNAQLVIVDSEGTSNLKTAYASSVSDFIIIPTRSSRLDFERTIETTEMLNTMCPNKPYRVLITQTTEVARSKGEYEIDQQIHDNLPTFDCQMYNLAAFRAMSNYRMTLSEIAASNIIKTDKARAIAGQILAYVLQNTVNKVKDVAHV